MGRSPIIMKIGMNLLLWTSNVTPNDHPVLRNLKKTGFDGVEVPVFEGDLSQYKELGKVLRDLGLGATAVTVMGADTNPISPDKKIRAASIDRLKWVIDRSAAFGAEILCGPLHSALGVFSGHPPTKDEFARAVEAFKKVSDYAATAKVELAVEYLNRFENYFLTTARDGLKFVNAVDKPACGMMWDSFHAHIEEKSAAPCIEAIRARLKHVHISENDRGTPGTGQIHWQETFRALRKIGYDRWLTIEAFGRALPDLAAATRVWRDLFDKAENLSKDGLSFIRQEWKKAG